VWLDGAALDSGRVPLVDDGRDHTVRVILGEATRPAPEANRADAGQNRLR
jgi:hypothetical protein